MIDAACRTLVRQRAGDRCEYCRIPQADLPFVALHVEHVIPRQHGGADEPENLALGHHCNLHKGPNLTGLDPADGALVRLFDPRRQRWEEHFLRRGPVIVGLTATGRTTVRVLDMNAPGRVRLRSALAEPGDES